MKVQIMLPRISPFEILIVLFILAVCSVPLLVAAGITVVGIVTSRLNKDNGK
jgi:hypothetical protein